jgi:Tol biopolymer transport system component
MPRSRFFPLLALSATSILLLTCDTIVGPVVEPMDRLIFVSERDGVLSETNELLADIYGINEDGTGAANLTGTPARSYSHLRLSPDGSRIAFYSDRSGCYNVWTMNTDGSDPVQLTGIEPGERCNTFPYWSPDGSKIAFTSSRDPTVNGWDTYVMNADGSHVVNVSKNAGSSAVRSDYSHGWTPDGRVVFLDFAAGEPIRTYVVDIDGSNLEPLLEPGDRYPHWSPDGRLIAFVSERDGTPDVWVMNADGSGIRKLAAGGLMEPLGAVDPWSPDGSRLAFTGFADGSSDIHVIAADGTGLTRITDDAGADWFGGWSPDGTRIVFQSDRTGNLDLFTVTPDGSSLRQVTTDPHRDRLPLWIGGR